ncbi:MAG: MFS family permease [Candidatus Latescibacterota bacterium]|jgi:MFS family permease
MPKTNTPQFYAFQVLSGLEIGFAMPIFVLFFLSKGLGLTEFMGMMSIFNLSVFLLEVPSGALADNIGKKTSVILGMVCMALATLGMIELNGFVALAACFVIWGLGEALISGADSALLYDSLENKEAFAQIFGRANTARLSATVFGTLACGASIDYIGLVAPMWGAFAASLIGIVIALTFHEPIGKTSEKKHIGAQIRESISIFSNNHHLLIIALLGVVFHRVCGLVERPLSQPLLLQNGFSEATIGYMHSGFFLVAALGSFWVFRLVKKGDMWAFGSSGALMVLSLAVLSYAGGNAVVYALAGVFLVRGVTFPTVQHSLNQQIPSEQRATCLSIAKMGSNLSGVILGPLLGYIADEYSIGISVAVLQWSFTLFLLILLWNLRK